MATSTWSPLRLATLTLAILTTFALVDARPPYADPRHPSATIPKFYTRPGQPANSNSSNPNADSMSLLAAVRYKGAEKYFREATWSAHFDARFARRALRPDEKRLHLIGLVQTFLTAMNGLNLDTWIMHGSLLGWWWNQKIMPFDDDVDVMTSISSMNFLADYYNMTVHRYQLAFDPTNTTALVSPPNDYLSPAREYLLDINPHFRNGSTADRYNVIDARWIDVATGLYIDITTLRPNTTGMPGSMMVKDKHTYKVDDIYPLRDTLFEGIPCKVPFEYSKLLTDEYGPQSLTQRSKLGYRFNGDSMEWVKLPQAPTVLEAALSQEQNDAALMLAGATAALSPTPTPTWTPGLKPLTSPSSTGVS